MDLITILLELKRVVNVYIYLKHVEAPKLEKDILVF